MMWGFHFVAGAGLADGSRGFEYSVEKEHASTLLGRVARRRCAGGLRAAETRGFAGVFLRRIFYFSIRPRCARSAIHAHQSMGLRKGRSPEGCVGLGPVLIADWT